MTRIVHTVEIVSVVNANITVHASAAVTGRIKEEDIM